MKKKRSITDRNAMETENTLWDQQEIIRILSNRPGTAYQEAADNQKAGFRRWTESLLRNGPVTVEFVKSDGTLRTMRCTLDQSLIDAPMPMPTSPGLTEPKIPTRTRDVHVQTVWDLEAQQWRSFRYDRLKNITVNIGLG
jgi:hypothetical protein